MDVAWWALIVAGLSFVVSVLTYWRNRTPKPKLVITWDYGDGEEPILVTKSMRCHVENRGRGVARDVTLKVVTVDERTGYGLAHSDTLGFGQSIELWFSAEDGADSDSGGFHRGELQWYDPDSNGTHRRQGIYVAREVAVKVTWHEEPNLARPHELKRRFTFD